MIINDVIRKWRLPKTEWILLFVIVCYFGEMSSRHKEKVNPKERMDSSSNILPEKLGEKTDLARDDRILKECFYFI